MSKLEQHIHYSPPPAPPDEVNVKSLVSKFSQKSLSDKEIKLPPEKQRSKYKLKKNGFGG
jgi:hypothetical protein